MAFNINMRYLYVWNEWFSTVDEVMVDPRCEVDQATFKAQLEYLPIQQAVLAHPWDVSGYPPEALKRIKKGMYPDVALMKRGRMPRMFFRLHGLGKIEIIAGYRRHSRAFRGHVSTAHNEIYNRFSKEIGAKVPYVVWRERVNQGWDCLSAAYQDFKLLIFGRKYNSWQEIRADYPWLPRKRTNRLFEKICL